MIYDKEVSIKSNYLLVEQFGFEDQGTIEFKVSNIRMKPSSLTPSPEPTQSPNTSGGSTTFSNTFSNEDGSTDNTLPPEPTPNPITSLNMSLWICQDRDYQSLIGSSQSNLIENKLCNDPLAGNCAVRNVTIVDGMNEKFTITDSDMYRIIILKCVDKRQAYMHLNYILKNPQGHLSKGYLPLPKLYSYISGFVVVLFIAVASYWSYNRRFLNEIHFLLNCIEMKKRVFRFLRTAIVLYLGSILFVNSMKIIMVWFLYWVSYSISEPIMLVMLGFLCLMFRPRARSPNIFQDANLDTIRLSEISRSLESIINESLDPVSLSNIMEIKSFDPKSCIIIEYPGTKYPLSLANHVGSIDDSYISNRIARIERTTNWTADHYLSWRSNLLDQKAKNLKLIVRDIGDRRDDYLKIRFQLLESKYKKQQEQNHSHPKKLQLPISSNTSNIKSTPSSSTTTPSSPSVNTTPTSTPSASTTPITSSPSTSHRNGNHTSSSIQQQQQQQIDFSFSGIHHIFDQHKQSITRIKFANNNKDLLAFSSEDGALSIVTGYFSPSILAKLTGHQGAITDFCWSLSNDQIITTSIDGTIRTWSTSSFKCLKLIKDAGSCLCICSHPLKQNIVLVSEPGKSLVKILDIDTGKWVSKVKTAAPITTMDFESKGNYLALGDIQGVLYIFKYSNDSLLAMVSKLQVSTNNKPITCVSIQYWTQNQKPMLSILVNSKDSILRVYMVKSLSTGSLSLIREYNVPMKSTSVKSIFSPSNSDIKREGAFLVTGSEDCNIYIYDIEQKEKRPMNQLFGHSSPVIDLAFNNDESLLATSDTSGMVIIQDFTITIENLEKEDRIEEGEEEKRGIIIYFVKCSGVRFHFGDHQEEIESLKSRYKNCLIVLAVIQYGVNSKPLVGLDYLNGIFDGVLSIVDTFDPKTSLENNMNRTSIQTLNNLIRKFLSTNELPLNKISSK
eukprot:gene8497-10443_t